MDFDGRGAEALSHTYAFAHYWSRHPANPLANTRPGRLGEAFFESAERLLRHYDKPGFGLEHVLLGLGVEGLVRAGHRASNSTQTGQ